MSLEETIKSITAEQLNNAINANISAFEQNPQSNEHLYGWLRRTYPEFAAFAETAPQSLFEDPAEIQPELIDLIVTSTAITLGALCRVIETRDLLGE